VSGWTTEEMAALAALDIPEGSIVNLGIGMPEQIANHLPEGREIVLHSENGILGMGGEPSPGTEDADLINAGKKPVTLLRGGAFFHHADSFAMIRGGHIDICVMGAFEVSTSGDLANWSSGKDGIPAVGGAMDLASGARSVRIMMKHVTRTGAPKLLRTVTLPATATGVVRVVYSDLAVLEPRGDYFLVRKLAPGISKEGLQQVTAAQLLFAPTVAERPVE
jgi:3-oxoadipate CoA-transferase, beta subunit